MNLKNIYLLLLLPLVFASCARVYTPALYHQDIAYQPKPASFDSLKSATYISGGLNAYSNINFTDFLTSGQLNISRGHVFDNFNIAYGAFGVFGDYQNGAISKGQTNYFSDKYFGAIGGRFSANLFIKSDRADFRFLGVEMAYSHEYGSYANFRQSLNNNLEGYYVDPRTNLFTIGLTTEVIFHSLNNSDLEHGIRGFIGTTLGRDDLNDTYYGDQTATDKMFRRFFPKASYFIKFKNYFGTVEVGEGFMLRFGYKF